MIQVILRFHRAICLAGVILAMSITPKNTCRLSPREAAKHVKFQSNLTSFRLGSNYSLWLNLSLINSSKYNISIRLLLRKTIFASPLFLSFSLPPSISLPSSCSSLICFCLCVSICVNLSFSISLVLSIFLCYHTLSILHFFLLTLFQHPVFTLFRMCVLYQKSN